MDKKIGEWLSIKILIHNKKSLYEIKSFEKGKNQKPKLLKILLQFHCFFKLNFLGLNIQEYIFSIWILIRIEKKIQNNI